MQKLIILCFIALASVSLSCLAEDSGTSQTASAANQGMQLGNFSVSLAVKDIAASRKFYETLGFAVRGGDQADNWLVMQNGTTIIGLFQGMFNDNILTFNPGWDNDGNELDEYTDVRELHARLKEEGLELFAEAFEKDSGPASFMMRDPDGNMILVDQHAGGGEAE